MTLPSTKRVSAPSMRSRDAAGNLPLRRRRRSRARRRSAPRCRARSSGRTREAVAVEIRRQRRHRRRASARRRAARRRRSLLLEAASRDTRASRVDAVEAGGEARPQRDVDAAALGQRVGGTLDRRCARASRAAAASPGTCAPAPPGRRAARRCIWSRMPLALVDVELPVERRDAGRHGDVPVQLARFAGASVARDRRERRREPGDGRAQRHLLRGVGGVAQRERPRRSDRPRARAAAGPRAPSGPAWRGSTLRPVPKRASPPRRRRRRCGSW